MDKYDLLFLLDYIKSIFHTIIDFLKKEKRVGILNKYNLMKKEWLLMQYYTLRNKRSVNYRKKHGEVGSSVGIHKALVLDRRKRYIWDMFKPVKEQENK
jgi:hypothetical protein